MCVNFFAAQLHHDREHDHDHGDPMVIIIAMMLTTSNAARASFAIVFATGPLPASGES